MHFSIYLASTLPHEKCIFVMAFVGSFCICACLRCNCFENIITYSQIRYIVYITASYFIKIACIRWKISCLQYFHRFLILLKNEKKMKMTKYSISFMPSHLFNLFSLEKKNTAFETIKIFTLGYADTVKSSYGNEDCENILQSSRIGYFHLVTFGNTFMDSWSKKKPNPKLS